ncbi:hypothetical protein P7C70_g3699, partial [Phenoliferia sp. Uapishka_3]
MDEPLEAAAEDSPHASLALLSGRYVAPALHTTDIRQASALSGQSVAPGSLNAQAPQGNACKIAARGFMAWDSNSAFMPPIILERMVVTANMSLAQAAPYNPTYTVMFPTLRRAVQQSRSLRLPAHDAIAAIPRHPVDKIAFKAPEADTTRGELGQVYLPDMSVHYIENMSISSDGALVPSAYVWQLTSCSILQPTAPDNYTLSSSAPDASAFPSFRAPQVFTAASLTTHPGGGPSHGSEGADDAILGEAGDSTSSIPKSQDISTKQIPFEPVERDLTAEESMGLVGLGAILVGGYLLGGLAEKKKEAMKE